MPLAHRMGEGGQRPGEGKHRPHIPIASLAKREEELFIPDVPDSIRLTADSPALHLVQHVRDEAHRFAITFHRERRGKKFLPKERASSR